MMNNAIQKFNIRKDKRVSLYLLHEDVINKTLLDLEIMGLINVTWLNKNTRRIEIVSNKNEEDDVELENKKSLENDYESSFPATKSDI